MVLYRLKLSLTEPCTAVKGTPIALKTCEGSKEPEVQAEPDDAQIPFSFKSNKIASPSTNSKLILVVFGRRCVLCPFTLGSCAFFQYFILQLVPQLFYPCSFLAHKFFASSQALPSPIIDGTFSVPPRRFFSWCPPIIKGENVIPFLTNKAPTPLGECNLCPERVNKSIVLLKDLKVFSPQLELHQYAK